jgi:hypothetical protein
VIGRLALVAALVVSTAAGAAGQETIRLADPGPGGGPRGLAQTLAGSYTVIPPASTKAILSSKSTYPNTVVILGRDAIVEDTVRGDVIVIGGDLYMHPGADVSGRAVAIGGGVYESTQARVGGGVRSYRDFTYTITRVPGGWSLAYKPLEAEEPLRVEGTYGLQVPTYDRSDGLSIAIAPALPVPGTHLSFEPRATYRSQLGRVDPSIQIVDSLDPRSALRLSAGRSTFSNDAWIWTDLINSLEVLWRGDDSRNYFRATRGELTLDRLWKTRAATIRPYLGARVERARSVRPGSQPTSGPWSFLARTDSDDMRRPNPPIDPGVMTSALAGVDMSWTMPDLTARLRLDGELGSFDDDCDGCDLTGRRKFAQTTIDGGIAFPTFGTQRLSFDAHAVLTTRGGRTPRQRWAYVGGSGSIPTLDMLSLGGDQLAYVDARYDIPIDRVRLPLGGSPVVTLREILGGAAIGRFPTLAQATGVRLSAKFLYVEWLIDPATRHQHYSYGVTVAR